MKPSNGQGPTDNDDFPDATMIDSSLQDDNQSWQGHEAPVDDFSDPAAEGMAHVTEASEEAMDADTPDSTSAKNTTKSPMKWMPAATVVGGIIFIGALLYLQFGSPPPTSSIALLQQKPAATGQLPAPPETQSNAAVAPTSSLTPISVATQGPSAQPSSSINAMEQKGVALPESNGLVPTTAPPSSAETSAELNATVPAKKPSQNEMANFETYDTAKSALLLPDREQPATAAPQTDATAKASSPIATPPDISSATSPQPVAAESSPSSNANLTSLTSQIENLQKELKNAQQQLAQANARLQELQDETSASSKAANNQLSLSLPSNDEDSFETQKKQPPPSSVKKKRTDSTQKSTRTVAKKPDASGQIWVLRAAGPDEAWVSKAKDSRAIQPVRIGDALSGIGRITAIRQDGDSWIVEGTQGIVK
ncbi:MAG: hypothetical protein ABTQ34_00090 [Bdellovibrionales bacterium]